LSHLINQPTPLPNPLSKAKSSTYISPEQSETLMYNTKVTLTLRRSHSRSNGELKKPYENGKETLKRIQRNNSFNVDRRTSTFSEHSEENQIDCQVREGIYNSSTTPKPINRYYFGETPEYSESKSSPYAQQVHLIKKQSSESHTGPQEYQGYCHVPEARNSAPRPPPLSSKPHLQKTVCFQFTHSKLVTLPV